MNSRSDVILPHKKFTWADFGGYKYQYPPRRYAPGVDSEVFPNKHGASLDFSIVAKLRARRVASILNFRGKIDVSAGRDNVRDIDACCRRWCQRANRKSIACWPPNVMPAGTAVRRAVSAVDCQFSFTTGQLRRRQQR